MWTRIKPHRGDIANHIALAADFEYTISRLAPIGEKMAILLA